MQSDFWGQKYACILTIMILQDDDFLKSYDFHQMRFHTWEGLAGGLIFRMLKKFTHIPKSCWYFQPFL
jgi:hypothetical protein